MPVCAAIRMLRGLFIKHSAEILKDLCLSAVKGARQICGVRVRFITYGFKPEEIAGFIQHRGHFQLKTPAVSDGLLQK